MEAMQFDHQGGAKGELEHLAENRRQPIVGGEPAVERVDKQQQLKILGGVKEWLEDRVAKRFVPSPLPISSPLNPIFLASLAMAMDSRTLCSGTLPKSMKRSGCCLTTSSISSFFRREKWAAIAASSQ